MPETKKNTQASQKQTARKIEIPTQVVDIQKRVLNGQRALFDTTFNAVSTMQDSQAKAWNGLLERSSMIPAQVREISEAWQENRREARDSYKETVDRSFALVEDWIDGLSGSRA